MATQEDVRKAVAIVAEPLLNNGWEPWRATHIEKEAYSLLFVRPRRKSTLKSAVCAIAAVQSKVAQIPWKHAPLVIIFPFEKYRLNVTIPTKSARGKHTINCNSDKSSNRRNAGTYGWYERTGNPCGRGMVPSNPPRMHGEECGAYDPHTIPRRDTL